jgi:type IV pilus assembly protein PilA
MATNKGFTLIEVMIVVAILGILASIAIISYQTYTTRAQLITALLELNGAKNQYELIMNDGATSSAFTISNMFIDEKSAYCEYKVLAPIAGVAQPALECVLSGNVSSILLGKSIYLSRNVGGVWRCSISSGIDSKFKPADCN